MEQKEKEGLIFIVITILIAGAVPIIVKYGTGLIHPLFFATISSLIACSCLLVLSFVKGNLKIIFCKEYFFQLFLIGFFGVTLANVLFFFGVTLTSGINSSILLQVEPLYGIFMGYILLHEKITLKQTFLTFIIIIGTLVVISKIEFSFNWGDLLILLTPICWQITHFLSKRLMTLSKEITPLLIATARTFYGGIFLFFISNIVGVAQFNRLTSSRILGIILFQGVIGFALLFFIWYEAISRINVSKATALISVYPTFSIILAMLVLREVPTFYQIIGFFIILIGIFGLAGIKSEQRDKVVSRYPSV